MKRIRKLAKTLGAAAIAFVLVCNPLCITKVSAGASDLKIDSSSFAEKLDETVWNAPNGDVTVENNKIIFNSESMDGTRLVTRNAIRLSEYHTELFQANYTVNLKNLMDSKFIVMFALESLESNYGELGNVELVFEDADGLQASLVTYDDNGETVVLAENKRVSGKNLKISVLATTDNVLTVSVNGNKLFGEKVETELTGRVGLAVTGPVEVEISKVDILSHRYDRPENTNIVEDFEKGTINTNTLYSMMKANGGGWPSYLVVEEFEGNQVLMFRNVGTGYIGTVHQYSNFELSFDMPYIQYRSIMREEGSIISDKSRGLVVSFGDELSEYDSLKYRSAPEAIVIGNESINRLKDSSMTANLKDTGYYSRNENIGYSVKIRVVDGQVTIYAKSLASETFDEVLSYSMGNVTPLGYIHIWSNEIANVAIDNLVITNLDDNPNTVELDYKEGFIQSNGDWNYQPMEKKYRDTEIVEEKDNSPWLWVAVAEAAVGVLFVLGAGAYAITRKKSRKEAGAHHEN